jgi:hypothetical protein
MTGKGRDIFADGGIYLGYYNLGDYEGIGIYIWPDG